MKLTQQQKKMCYDLGTFVCIIDEEESINHSITYIKLQVTMQNLGIWEDEFENIFKFDNVKNYITNILETIILISMHLEHKLNVTASNIFKLSSNVTLGLDTLNYMGKTNQVNAFIENILSLMKLLDIKKSLIGEVENITQESSMVVKQSIYSYFSKGNNNEKNISINEPKNSINYDLFISYASEDKKDFVEPLVEELKKLGINVWYDKFTLKVGDSLREKIDEGLKSSRYGTIIISTSFIQKSWTGYELNSMITKEMNGHKIILPIWHKVTKDEVLDFSLALADKVALNTSINSIDEIAKQLAEVINNS